MTKSFLSLALLGVLTLGGILPAWAQQTPRDIQGLIDAGQDSQAIQSLHNVLSQHPDSGTGWYLMAEAQDASGNEHAAAQALAKADQYAPGLPFANPQSVSALRAHINQSGGTYAPAHHGGVSPVLLIIGGLVLLFIVLRLFSGIRRRAMGPVYRQYPGNQPMPYGNYPQPPAPYGPGYQQGGGLGSSIVSGLAAGAGFAAGERVVDDLFGGERARPMDDNAGNFVPDRDDGLNGNPGWDSGSDDDLNNNSW